MSFIALCCMVSHQPEHRLHHANPDDAVLTIFITKAIIDLQLEISASAQRYGIVYSGRCLADPQGWHRPEDKMCGASLRSVADLVLQVAGLTVAAELGQRRLVQLKQDLAQHLRRWIEASR